MRASTLRSRTRRTSSVPGPVWVATHATSTTPASARATAPATRGNATPPYQARAGSHTATPAASEVSPPFDLVVSSVSPSSASAGASSARRMRPMSPSATNALSIR